MRVALVSPYSWTYPGGVSRHVEGLAVELLAAGHEVRVLAPYDPAGRASELRHRGRAPQAAVPPDWLVPLGPTVGWPSNGAVSNLAVTPSAVSALRRELAAGAFDVVHVHEPVAPVVSWDALTATTSEALVGTFHCYSEKVGAHAVANLAGARRKFNRLHVRIAVSAAAEWTARRFYGGRYRVIPNGVAGAPLPSPEPPRRSPSEPLRIVFVGQAVERKGLPVLLRAFEALRREVPATLTVVGPEAAEVAPMLVDMDGVTALGRASEDEKRRALEAADVACTPSLGGESFGIVLAESFAAGRPVIASDIAGYRDVVTHGHDGLLVPRGDATALAETLRELAGDPRHVARLAVNAGRSAERYAWPRIAAEVAEAYEDALAVPAAESRTRRAGVRIGALPADGRPRVPASRLPSPDSAPETRRWGSAGRTSLLAAAGALAAGASYLAVDKVGVGAIAQALVSSSPAWVLAGLALMCLSMGLRSVSWHAILRAALPEARPRLSDAFQGTAIGVLMSATLPARLGEPSRALIVSRRLGDPRARLPVVLGTLVSQTLLNLLALVILGTVMVASIGLFEGGRGNLLGYVLVPIAALWAVVAAPALLSSGIWTRSARVAGWLVQARRTLTKVRSGLRVFTQPRLGAVAVLAQLSAWGLQWLSCFLLLVALGLDDRVGLAAAAAVLFAVNVTAVLPVTPSNVGMFQAACVAVLTGAYGIPAAEALGYGIILQAVEVATAVMLGAPALVKEGTSWREVRLRALHTTPVSLSPRPRALPEPAA